MDLLNGLSGDIPISLIHDDSLSDRPGSNLVGIPITTFLALVHVRPELRARLVIAARFGTLLPLGLRSATTPRSYNFQGQGFPQSNMLQTDPAPFLVSALGHYVEVFVIFEANLLKT